MFCLFLYCNHQVHRDFLNILYIKLDVLCDVRSVSFVPPWRWRPGTSLPNYTNLHSRNEKSSLYIHDAMLHIYYSDCTTSFASYNKNIALCRTPTLFVALYGCETWSLAIRWSWCLDGRGEGGWIKLRDEIRGLKSRRSWQSSNKNPERKDPLWKSRVQRIVLKWTTEK
jgi:hypothetical protein